MTYWFVIGQNLQVIFIKHRAFLERKLTVREN